MISLPLSCQLLASSESLCTEAFDTAWKIISALSNTQLTFWSNLKAFVQFVFDTKVLTVAAKIKGQAYLKIKEVTFFFLIGVRTHNIKLNIATHFRCACQLSVSLS